MVVPTDLVPLLEEMLYELMENRLEVQLVPGTVEEKNQDGCLTRAVTSCNVDWYKELCNQYHTNRTNKRKHTRWDTKIKRKYIENVLKVMINKGVSNSMYADDLLTVAKDRFTLYEKVSLLGTQDEQGISWNNQF